METNNNPISNISEILSSNGENKESWNNFLCNIISGNTKSIQETVFYLKQKLINKEQVEIILDMIDFLINFGSQEIIEQIAQKDFLYTILSLLKNKSKSGVNIQKKIIFLTQKWHQKFENDENPNVKGFSDNYNLLKKGGIIFPPQNYQIQTYNNYISEEEAQNSLMKAKAIQKLTRESEEFKKSMNYANPFSNGSEDINNNQENNIFSNENDNNDNEDNNKIMTNEAETKTANEENENENEKEDEKEKEKEKETEDVDDENPYKQNCENDNSNNNSNNNNSNSNEEKESFSLFENNNINQNDNIINNHKNDEINENNDNKKMNNLSQQSNQQTNYPSYPSQMKNEGINNFNNNKNNNQFSKSYDVRNQPNNNMNNNYNQFSNYNNQQNNNNNNYNPTLRSNINNFNMNNNNNNNNYNNSGFNGNNRGEQNDYIMEAKYYKRTLGNKLLQLNAWINEGKFSFNSGKLKNGIKEILDELSYTNSLMQRYQKIGQKQAYDIIRNMRMDIEQTCARYEALICDRMVEPFYSTFQGNTRQYYYNVNNMFGLDQNYEYYNFDNYYQRSGQPNSYNSGYQNQNNYGYQNQSNYFQNQSNYGYQNNQVQKEKTFGDKLSDIGSDVKDGLFRFGRTIKNGAVSGYKYIKKKISDDDDDKNNNNN